MNDDKKYERTHEERIDDQDEPKTANEIIREVNGDPNMNLNDLKRTGGDSSSHFTEGDNVRRNDFMEDDDLTADAGYTPQDGSRSVGIANVNDESAGGVGYNSGIRNSDDSNMAAKTNITGSDFDGQDTSSGR